MWALFNPPKNAGRKKMKCSCAGFSMKKRAGSKKRKPSSWLTHMKAYGKLHPELHGGALAKAAAPSYTRGAKPAYARLTPEQRLAELELEGMKVPSGLRKTVESRKARCDLWKTYGRYVKGRGQAALPSWCGPGGVRTSPKSAVWSGLKSASELRTPSGARIFKVANNRGSMTMARRRSRGRSFRLLGYNVGGLVGSMKQPTATGSVTDSVQPKNIMGAVPVIGGVIANSMLTSFFAKYIPMTKKGAGNYALGLGTAGILGGLAGFVNADVAKGVLLGGVVETVGRLIADLRKGGVGALSLGGIDGEDDDLSGLGSGQSVPAEELSGLNDFVTPGAIQRAIPSESTMTQYSLPAASAPARMHEAYQRKVLAEMIGDGEE